MKIYKIIFLLIFNGLTIQSATIKGYVKDIETKEPIPSAVLIIQNAPRGATTDINGYYVITSVESGKCVVSVSRIGYCNTTDTITVAYSSEVVTRDIFLSDIVIKPIKDSPETRNYHEQIQKSSHGKDIITIKIDSLYWDTTGLASFHESLINKYDDNFWKENIDDTTLSRSLRKIYLEKYIEDSIRFKSLLNDTIGFPFIGVSISNHIDIPIYILKDIGDLNDATIIYKIVSDHDSTGNFFTWPSCNPYNIGYIYQPKDLFEILPHQSITVSPIKIGSVYSSFKDGSHIVKLEYKYQFFQHADCTATDEEINVYRKALRGEFKAANTLTFQIKK